MSCEPRGFDNSHPFKSQIEIRREFKIIDTSLSLISGSEAKHRRTFTTNLLNKRLEAANYEGRVANLIGESKYKKDTELAKQIHSKGQGTSNHYHGDSLLIGLLVWRCHNYTIYC